MRRTGDLVNEDRVKKLLAKTARDEEKEAAEEIQSMAHLRRALYLAYLNAGFERDEAVTLLAAELAGPTIVFGGEDEE